MFRVRFRCVGTRNHGNKTHMCHQGPGSFHSYLIPVLLKVPTYPSFTIKRILGKDFVYDLRHL